MISIIVPVYKTEQYLRRCIDSILSQTYKDFELILVDDGSPDSCPIICDEYAERDLRVKVIHQENSGVSAARNAGIDAANGEYIMFCDSDDYVSENWCEAMLKAFISKPDAIIFCPICRFDGDTFDPLEYRFRDEISYLDFFKTGTSGMSYNRIFKASLIRKFDLKFDLGVKVAEDVLFVNRYSIYNGHKEVYFCPDTVYYYRTNPNGTLHSFHENWLGYHLDAFYVRLPLISDEQIGDYCDSWIYSLINMLDNVFDKRCKLSFINKLKYNQAMLKSEKFQFCLNNCSDDAEDLRVLKILRTGNYLKYYLYQKLYRLKRALKG